MIKTLLVSAAFLGASVIGAAAQSSTSPSPGSANISAATHCKDKATGQARLKTAAKPAAPAGSTTGAASGSMSGSTGGTSGSAAGSAGSTPGGAGSAPSAAANLPDCP
jgi:hypothetical protein